jgi:hypothetical protein
MNRYLCKFDSQGYRNETYLSCEYTDEQKQEMFNKGFVEIDEEEWKLYCEDGGNKYIRVDGKPVLAPPHIPSKEEKISQLEAEYEAQKTELKGYLMDAMLSDDADTIDDLKQEMADIEAEYQLKREELEG